MKRMIPVAIILTIITFLTIWSSVKMERSTDELSALLQLSKVQVENEEYDRAKQTLKDYFVVLERNELFYRYFLRRDLYNNLVLYPGQLDALANQDHRNDFISQATYSLYQIELIQKMLLKPS